MIDSEQYHRLPGISSSGFRDFLCDKQLLLYNLKKQKDKPATKGHFFIGHAIHAVLTNTGKIKAESEEGMLTKSQMEVQRVKLRSQNIFLLKDSDFEMASSWINSCKSSEITKGLFDNPKALYEVSFFTFCKTTGLLIKFCPDIIDLENRVIVDLKTSAGWQNWERTVEQYDYDIQKMFYLYCSDCVFGENKVTDFVFLYLSKKPPFRVSPKGIGLEQSKLAKGKVKAGLVDLKFSFQNGYWGSLVDQDIEYC